jgi:hypothetical protein
MKIIRLSQSKDREAWLELRWGKVTGTKGKGLRPLSRGADRTPQGFYELLAERLSIQPDGENVMARGLRCEDAALQLTADKVGKTFDLDPGVWVDEYNDNIILSPDAAQKGDKPTYAAEAKCFNSANHLRIILSDKRNKKIEGYNPFNSIPKENQDQALDYFAINPDLKTLYFTLYDDRIIFEELMHYVIEIKRAHVEPLITELKTIQVETLLMVEDVIKELLDGSK